MTRLRVFIAGLLSFSLLTIPVWGEPTAPMGTVVSAERAHVGTANASVGTTVFQGDKLSTEALGTVQVRAGAARLMLSASSHATLGNESGLSYAVLDGGTAVFSTANAKAFELRAASAVFRPATDAPTVGQISVAGPRELLVKSTRGSLSITVDDQTEIIPEGAAYRMVLNPTATEMAAAEAAQGPRGVGTTGPRHGGRDRFVLFAIAVAAAVTAIFLYRALQSPDRP